MAKNARVSDKTRKALDELEKSLSEKPELTHEGQFRGRVDAERKGLIALVAALLIVLIIGCIIGYLAAK